jgi:hypothetical protein
MKAAVLKEHPYTREHYNNAVRKNTRTRAHITSRPIKREDDKRNIIVI